MDQFTLHHFSQWVERSVHPDYKDDFLDFALDILAKPDELAYYMQNGWPKLRERFYRDFQPCTA